MIFGRQPLIHTSVEIRTDILVEIFMQGHSTMDIRGTNIIMNGYPCFYDYQSLIVYAFVDIHLDIHRFLCTCMQGLVMDPRSRVLLSQNRPLLNFKNRPRTYEFLRGVILSEQQKCPLWPSTREALLFNTFPVPNIPSRGLSTDIRHVNTQDVRNTQIETRLQRATLLVFPHVSIFENLEF